MSGFRGTAEVPEHHRDSVGTVTRRHGRVRQRLLPFRRVKPETAAASGKFAPDEHKRATVLVCHLAGNVRFETISDLK